MGKIMWPHDGEWIWRKQSESCLSMERWLPQLDLKNAEFLPLPSKNPVSPSIKLAGNLHNSLKHFLSDEKYYISKCP